uniref:Immunoglobulin domain-containing protein n=1 Tax=Cyprinus carpio TaxID=7962 RepID=A0A8C2JAX8_CYPCA
MAVPVVGGLTGKFFASVAVFAWLAHGFLSVNADIVSESVSEGDSVTLSTGIKKNQNDRFKWYFNDTRIAQITGDPSKTCTDVQCNEGTERFRDRLKLDHQTGSLTIMNITNTDSGVYELKINSSNDEDTFNVSVHGVSAAERDAMKKSVEEGQSVTLDPGVIKQPNHVMMWYFNDTCIAEITGDQSKICTDVQCKERFKDRLELDHQTGSLTIMNTRNTDSGLYELKIKSSRNRFSITSIKSFTVSITGKYHFWPYEREQLLQENIKENVVASFYFSTLMSWYQSIGAFDVTV